VNETEKCPARAIGTRVTGSIHPNTERLILPDRVCAPYALTAATDGLELRIRTEDEITPNEFAVVRYMTVDW
jgi:hypothetical protein